MSLKDAERTLKGMGKTIKQNAPGPKQLWQGFLETHVFSPAFPFLIMIGFLLLFGEPIAAWLTRDDNCPRHGGVILCDADRRQNPRGGGNG